MSFGIRSFVCNICTFVFIMSAASAQRRPTSSQLQFTSSFSNLVVCNDTNIVWEGGEAPYTLTWLVQGQIVETGVVLNDNNFDWDPVDIGPDAPVVVILADNSGQNITTSPFSTTSGTQTCDLAAGTLNGHPSASTSLLENTSSHTPPKTTGGTSNVFPSTASIGSFSISPTADPPSVTGSLGKPSGPNPLAIGLAVVAIVLSMVIIALAVLWYRRKQRRRRQPEIDLLADDNLKFDPSLAKAQVIHPFDVAGSIHTTNEPDVVFVERPAEENAAGRVMIAQFNGATDSLLSQPTSADMTASARPRKHFVEPPFQTVRLDPWGYSSDGASGSSPSGYPPSNSTTTYPPTNLSSVSVASSTSSSPRNPSAKLRREVVNAPSVRTDEADFPANESQLSLVPPGLGRREVDGGISVAGGRVRRESWFNNLRRGTLPPAYDEY